MSTLSTHVLDTALGRPAEGVRVTLERGAEVLASGVTDADGRVREWSGAGTEFQPGAYRLRFWVEEYFTKGGRDFFYTEITVNFKVASEPHYHVPLLLSPFGYSTYRGS